MWKRKKINFDKDKAKRVYENFKKDSEEMIDDQSEFAENVNKASEKAKRVKDDKSTFGMIFEDFGLMLKLLKSYNSKEYRKVPKGIIVAAMAGVLYFLSPVDAILDFIPGLGYIDDVFVISYVLKKIHNELQDFKVWHNNRHLGGEYYSDENPDIQ